MVKCHKCGHDNEEGHEFCEECGSKLKVELKCKKCGHHLKPDEDFCEECGAKIKESKAPHHEHKTESKLAKYKWWIIIAVIVLLLGVISVFAVSLPYEAKEGYTEKVPYTDTETYYENEAYQGEECSNIYPQYNTDKNSEWVAEGFLKVICTISNFEGQPVTFQYKLYTTRISDGCTNDEIDSFQDWVTIGAGQTIKKERTLKSGCFGCYATPNQIQKCKQITKFRDVPKTRTTTKYKDEYKERFVTKYATLFQQWSGQAKYYYKV